jgi:hypothetical protein
MDKPSLLVVGTGIRVIGQMTTETAAWIQQAEKVLYLVYDPVAAEIIDDLNGSAESLAGFFAEGKPRRQSLEEMVGRVLECVRTGVRTCLVLLGHPGVFSWLGHEAVRQARQAGFTAKMLPAISAEDCLFADLGLDPGSSGCQLYEAMDFLNNSRIVDPSSLLILWQVGVMGDPLYKVQGYDLSPLPRLIDRLGQLYGLHHEVIVYVAPIHWEGEPQIERVSLGQLATARLSASSTLCVPPRPDSD